MQMALITTLSKWVRDTMNRIMMIEVIRRFIPIRHPSGRVGYEPGIGPPFPAVI